MKELRELYEKLNVMLLRMFSSIRSEKGQTLVEYALLLVLIAIVVYMMVKGVGLTANNTYSKINSALITP
jgi:pilus assembly protein Flp/PilA